MGILTAIPGREACEKHAVARITLQQVAAPELSHTLAEAGEAAGRRRAGAELHGRDWKRQEAEQHVDEVGARVGEKDAVPRAVHGELDLDAAGHSPFCFQTLWLLQYEIQIQVQEAMVGSSVTLYASSAIGRRIQVMEKENDASGIRSSEEVRHWCLSSIIFCNLWT